MTDVYFKNLSNAKENNSTLRTISILNGYLQKKEFYESTCLLPYDINNTRVYKTLKKLKVNH